jgi:hypothetical protein
MPVIFTCAHGGDEQPPGVPNRRTGMDVPADCRFETNTDRFTRTITRALTQLLSLTPSPASLCATRIRLHSPLFEAQTSCRG